MKRITAFLLLVFMVVFLSACEQSNISETTENNRNEIITENGSINIGSESEKPETVDRATPENFVLIEGGSFQMGSSDDEAWRSKDELQHTVDVSDFYMSRYELTQAKYEAVMGTNPSNFSGKALPVENISWLDAIAYCNARSRKERLTPVYTVEGQNVTWDRSADGYRLPTEAEWEYACRVGTITPFYMENSPSAEEANYYGHYPYQIEENYYS